MAKGGAGRASTTQRESHLLFIDDFSGGHGHDLIAFGDGINLIAIKDDQASGVFPLGIWGPEMQSELHRGFDGFDDAGCRDLISEHIGDKDFTAGWLLKGGQFQAEAQALAIRVRFHRQSTDADLARGQGNL
jgi:hypothetical protein